MEVIPITDFTGIRIGQAEDPEGATGLTVIIAPDGMAAGIDVRGGGPASRDSRTLDPLAAAEFVHAVVLGGGSAFGLDAAGGVMRYLAEHGIGLDVGDVKVPLVCQSDIFDLWTGSATAYPDADMGYAACVASEAGNYRDGNFGAGCGASVGKLLGMGFAMKAGIGSYAVQLGGLQVGAIVAVNAMGDVRDPATGAIVAGMLSDDRQGLRDSAATMFARYETRTLDLPQGTTNTTIGAIVTNARLSKAQLCKLAGMAHDGYARAISPVHTSMDGDTIYGLSVGGDNRIEAELDLVGTLAAEVMSQAILVAARSAEAAYGLPSAT